MGRRLRVFISSTMRDLANERDAVVRLLRSYNFEPVNAENLLATGAGSWDTLREEIASCDLFLLLLGERYGWFPEEGPHAGKKLSVTHLEYLEARALDPPIPILPFCKRLDYSSKPPGDEARQRDALREEISSWKDGYFVGRDFDLAADLAELVGRTVIQLLCDRFLHERMEKRSSHVVVRAQRGERDHRTADSPAHASPADVTLSDELVDAVRTSRAVLLAGSGISLRAGFPSALALQQRFTLLIDELEPGWSSGAVTGGLAGAAATLAALSDRATLERALLELMKPPQDVSPTAAHRHAVRLFDRILTTNYDLLFEGACALEGIAAPVFFDELDSAPLPPRAILKLHGSMAAPRSVLLTENEVYSMDRLRRRLWDSALELLRSRFVVALGSSLRDPSLVRLLCEAGIAMRGVYVVPEVRPSTARRVAAMGLDCIASDADAFLEQLAARCAP